MSLVRFDVGSELDDLRREVNQVFSPMSLPSSLLPSGPFGLRFMPAMDTYERDGALCISMDLPGMDQEDVDVEVRGDLLTISGAREIDREGADGTWYRYERSTGSFERSLRLPEAIEPGMVDARFEGGVLTITIPLPESAPVQSAKVDIKTTTDGRAPRVRPA